MKRLLLFLLLSVNLIYSQNWTTSNTNQSSIIDNVSVVNDNIIWIMDQIETNGFSISTDGGTTWSHKNFPSEFINNNFGTGVLSAVDENIAYLIVSYGDNQDDKGLYKTIDAGNTWLRESALFNGVSSFPNQVHFWDANQGIAMGDGLELYEYWYGAWYPYNVSSIGAWSLNSSQYLKIRGSSAYFLTNAGTIMKWNNYTFNWTEIITPFNSYQNVNFDFKDDLNGILVFNDNFTNELYTTTDGGTTWDLSATDVTNIGSRIKYEPNQGRFYAASSNYPDGGLSYSDDDGATWTIDPQFTDIFLGEIEASLNGKVFIGGDSNIYYQEPDFSNHPDYNALVALYNSTNGDNWTNNTNWLDNTKPLSSWHGVSLENNRVTQLALGGNNLTGTIPPEIGDLTDLLRLYLWSNQLTGNIPPEIGNLTKLTYIDLAPNNFSGSIPDEIGNLINLETLWLNQCGLSGSIPTSLENLAKLRYLYLHSSIGPGWPDNTSAYSGDFPDLTNLPLELLWINNNYFNFTDVADEIDTYKTNIPDFRFSPQFTTDTPLETNAAIGDDITLTLTDTPSTAKGMLQKAQLVDNNYQWYKDDVALTVNANSDTFVITNAQASDSGVYYCEITNTDVPDMVIQRQYITLNIGSLNIDKNERDQIKFYPNPTKNILNIELNNYSKADANLYDISGRLVLKQKLYTEQSVININSLNAGIYLLQIKTENRTATKRIIKQ